jgi:hypothetical protein
VPPPRGLRAAHAVAVRAAQDGGAVGEIVDAVVAPQAADRKREIRQAGAQQRVRHVERHRGADLASQRVGGDHHGLARAVDERHVSHAERSRIDVCGAVLVAVDEQVNGGRHGRLARELRQWVGDDVRAQREVARNLQARHAYRRAPGHRIVDQIAQFVGQYAILVRIAPTGVVTHVALGQCAAGERLLIGASAAQDAERAEDAQLVPHRRIAGTVVGIVGVRLVVEQCAEAAARRHAVEDASAAKLLLRQPVGRHVEQQAQRVAVVFGADAGHRVDLDQAVAVRRKLQADLTQIVAAHEVVPVTHAHRHDLAARAAIHDQFEELRVFVDWQRVARPGRRGQRRRKAVLCGQGQGEHRD